MSPIAKDSFFSLPPFRRLQSAEAVFTISRNLVYGQPHEKEQTLPPFSASSNRGFAGGADPRAAAVQEDGFGATHRR